MAVPMVEKMVTGSMTEKKGGRCCKQNQYVCVSQSGADCMIKGEAEAWNRQATAHLSRLDYDYISHVRSALDLIVSELSSARKQEQEAAGSTVAVSVSIPSHQVVHTPNACDGRHDLAAVSAASSPN